MSKELIIRDLKLEELRVSSDEYMKLYLDGKHDELAILILEVAASLKFYGGGIIGVSPKLQKFIDTFCSSVGYIFTQPKFQISNQNIVTQLLFCNTTFANMFELSCYGSTDHFLKALLQTENNFTKLLILYNAKSNIEIPYEQIYSAGAQKRELVSTWYGLFMNDNPPFTPQMQKKLTMHLQHPPKSLTIGLSSSLGYFNCTYVDSNLDKNYKNLFNSSVQNLMRANFTTKVDKKKQKIAIVSGRWFKDSAVYRSIEPYIRALSKKYELTLLSIGIVHETREIEKTLFNNVICLQRDDKTGKLNIAQIEKNDFSLLLYTDVGMDFESRILSNFRIAPLQATMYGHPVSTWGSKIDFFIGGKDTELETKASENYSEKLITIEGIGAVPLKSDYLPQEQKNCFRDKNILFLGSFYKINSHMVDTLVELKESVDKSIKPIFSFVPGSSAARNMSYVVLDRYLKNKLGDNTIVNLPLKRDTYMEQVNNATICLDSYPFGGFNTIMDALHLKKPVVAYEGTKAYNRLASAILKRLGLHELIATSQEEYIAIATRLLSDEAFYNKVVDHIEKLDIDNLLYVREDELEDFVDKIKMILDKKIKK